MLQTPQKSAIQQNLYEERDKKQEYVRKRTAFNSYSSLISGKTNLQSHNEIRSEYINMANFNFAFKIQECHKTTQSMEVLLNYEGTSLVAFQIPVNRALLFLKLYKGTLIMSFSSGSSRKLSSRLL